MTGAEKDLRAAPVVPPVPVGPVAVLSATAGRIRLVPRKGTSRNWIRADWAGHPLTGRLFGVELPQTESLSG